MSTGDKQGKVERWWGCHCSEKIVVEVVVVMLVVAKGGVVKVSRGNVSENGSAICREG